MMKNEENSMKGDEASEKVGFLMRSKFVLLLFSDQIISAC